MKTTSQKLLQTAANLLKAAANSITFGIYLTVASFGLLFYYYYGYTTDAGILGRAIAAEDHIYHIFFISTNIVLAAHYYSIADTPWHKALLKYYIMFRAITILYRLAAWSFNLVLVFNTPVYLGMLIITVAATRTSKIYARKDAVNYGAHYAFQLLRHRFFVGLGKIRAGHNRDPETEYSDRGNDRRPETQTPDQSATQDHQ